MYMISGNSYYKLPSKLFSLIVNDIAYSLFMNRLKLATMEKKLNKAKSHVSKLMNVVHLYEEILPAANHLAENYYDT